MDYYEEIRNKLKIKIEEKCLLRNVDLPGKGGSRYSWMFYMRPGLFDAKFINYVGQLFIHKIKQEIGNFDFQICGLETGAVPLLVGLPIIAELHGIKINAFSVRKEPKEYGLQNWIEGNPTNQKVLLVDDIVNSTSSLRRCFNILQSQNYEFSNYVFSIIKKDNPVHNPHYHMNLNTKYIYLFNVSEWGLS
jgi:orotate phosphoribosyltransferase